MNRILVFFILFSSPLAMAQLQMHIGGGLGYSSADFSVSAAEANHRGGGYIAEAGFLYKFSPGNFINLSAEYGQNSLVNSLSSSSQIEKSKNEFTSIKLGFFFFNIGIGVGQRQNSIVVSSASSSGNFYETKYTGQSIFPFAAISFNSSSSLMTTIEVQRHSGDVGSVKVNETAAFIKLQIVPSGLFSSSPFGNSQWDSP